MSVNSPMLYRQPSRWDGRRSHTIFLFLCCPSIFAPQIYLDWAVQLHNVFFTALPILIFAVLDRDISFETLERNPEIYPLTRGRTLFSVPIFARWYILSAAQACICFFFAFWAFGDMITSPDPNGQTFGLWPTGMACYTSIVLTTNLALIWQFRSWTWLHHLSLWGSTAVFFVAMAVLSSSTIFDIGGASYLHVFYRLAVLPSYWLVVLSSTLACVSLDLAVQGYVRIMVRRPSSLILIQQVEHRYGKSEPKLVRAMAKALAMEKLEEEEREMEEKFKGEQKRKQGKSATTGGKRASTPPPRKSSTSFFDDESMSPEQKRRAVLEQRSGKQQKATQQKPSSHAAAAALASRQHEEEGKEASEQPSSLPSSGSAGASGGAPHLLARHPTFTGPVAFLFASQQASKREAHTHSPSVQYQPSHTHSVLFCVSPFGLRRFCLQLHPACQLYKSARSLCALCPSSDGGHAFTQHRQRQRQQRSQQR